MYTQNYGVFHINLLIVSDLQLHDVFLRYVKKSNDVFMNGRIVVFVSLATGDNNVSICCFHFNLKLPLCLNFTTECEKNVSFLCNFVSILDVKKVVFC